MKNQNYVNSSDFLEEKIKARPLNRRRIIRRVVEVALLAVVFGLIACFTMIIVAPILEERLFKTPANEIILTEESAPHISEEMSPEDMLLEEWYEPDSSEEETDSEEQLLNLAYILRKSAQDCQKWLVQVAGVSSETSWLESTKTSSNIASGAIIADSGTEFLILVEKENLQEADRIEVTFTNDCVVQGRIKGTDAYSGFMVVAVSKEGIGEEILSEYQAAELASSNNKSLLGSVVLALGNTNGVAGSVNYGFVTSIGVEANSWDCNYKLIKTDIYGSNNPSGFLVNLKGQIIGVLCNDYNSTDTKNLLSAVGISDLKKKIECMSNEVKIPVLGIKGTDVTQQAHKENGIPTGAYVTNVKLSSPAMHAGIQAGDVIVKIGEKEISSMIALTYHLYQLKVGEPITVVIMRSSQGTYKESTLKITLGSQ